MKIRNKELYVQVYDIEFLLKETDILLPYSIMKYIWNGVIDFELENDFIKFDEKEAINFLEQFEYILDYNTLIDLPLSKIKEMKKEIIENNQNKIYDYLLKSLDKIILVKNKKLSFDLPTIARKNTLTLYDESKKYILKESIKENTLIITKNNNKKFECIDEVPISLLNTGFNVITLNSNQSFLLENNYIMKTKFSKDHKSLIIEYVPNIQKKSKKKKLKRFI